jgi:hypothetical protein
MKPMYVAVVGWGTYVALGGGIAGFLADLAGVRSALVTVLVLIFIAVAPTTAVAGLLRGFDLFARLILTCVTTITVLTLIAMIMLAIGIWSPKAGLVAIALVSGACLPAQHAKPFISKIAERAEPLRQAMVDYCVKIGGEQTAAWATTRTPAEPDMVADPAATPDEATAEPAEPVQAAGPDEVAGPDENPEAAAEQDQDPEAVAGPDENPEAAAEQDEAVGPAEAAANPDEAVETPAERRSETANGKPVAPDGVAQEIGCEPEVIAASSAAGKPPRPGHHLTARAKVQGPGVFRTCGG